MVLTGDVHANYVCDVKADFNDPTSATVASELVGTSVSTGGDGQDTGPDDEAQLPENPHIEFINRNRLRAQHGHRHGLDRGLSRRRLRESARRPHTDQGQLRHRRGAVPARSRPDRHHGARKMVRCSLARDHSLQAIACRRRDPHVTPSNAEDPR